MHFPVPFGFICNSFHYKTHSKLDGTAHVYFRKRFISIKFCGKSFSLSFSYPHEKVKWISIFSFSGSVQRISSSITIKCRIFIFLLFLCLLACFLRKRFRYAVLHFKRIDNDDTTHYACHPCLIHLNTLCVLCMCG